MIPIGIMQGRLSPPTDGRIQSFPVETWADEFVAAQVAGLACIEWIFEAGTDGQNPLATDDGIAAILEAEERTDVVVVSLCADYYMRHHLVEAGKPRYDRVEHLQWLIGRAAVAGIRWIVLPFVDSSSLKLPEDEAALRAVLEAALPAAERVGVELHLETDCSPPVLAELLDDVAHPLLRANYDTGNSVSLRHGPEVAATLGSRIGSVHIKDRVVGGGTVALGAGAADFATVFRLLSESSYARPFVIQAARGRDGDETALALHNRRFVEQNAALWSSV